MKKSTLALTLATTLCASTSNSAIINTDYSGLFTWLDSSGIAAQNLSYPYYGDATWGYGFRTQISGTMILDTNTGYGNTTVNPFEFLNGGPMFISDFEFQTIGGGLILSNMTVAWKSRWTVQVVLDASGLFAELPDLALGDVYNATTCTTSGACVTPASNNIVGGKYPIGPVPISTSSFNTAGQTGYGTTLNQLRLGTDDGIGGSPQDNGPFSEFNFNFDMTSLTVTDVTTVPVPAAVWLFGTGLLSLIGIARRRKN